MSLTLVTLLKRRPGMSRAAFRAYYESNHRLIGERVLAGHATRYERSYLTSLDGGDFDHDFDVILEIDFPNRAACDVWFETLDAPGVLEEIIADEERLFDRNRMRTYTIETSLSALPDLGNR